MDFLQRHILSPSFPSSFALRTGLGCVVGEKTPTRRAEKLQSGESEVAHCTSFLHCSKVNQNSMMILRGKLTACSGCAQLEILAPLVHNLHKTYAIVVL